MNGNIYINGVIGTFLDENGNVVEKGVELLDVILQVKNQPKATSFTVYINSPGGIVDTGFEIYDYLKAIGKPITTIGQGMVASIATVIFMAGQTRKLKNNTDFMIHLPSGGIDGNSNDIEAYSKYIKEVEKRIIKFYNETANLTDSEIIPLLQKETFLKGDEPFKLGFATEKTIAVEPVAYFQKPNSKINNKMSKTEASTLSKIWNILKGANMTNKIVFDVANNEIDFYELEDGATIELGAKANFEGQAANGEHKAPSEENPELILTYVFENGVLTAIKEPEVVEEVIEDNAELTALQAENELLKTQLAEKETASTALTEEVTALKDSNKSYKKAIAAIKALESDQDPVEQTKKKPTNEPIKNDISSEVTNWKKNKQLKKIK